MTSKKRFAILTLTMVAALSVALPTMLSSADADVVVYNVIECSDPDNLNSKGACIGTNGPDLMRGSSGVDMIFGLDGHDKIFGYDGDDWLYGGEGDDYIVGGDNHDFIMGDIGSDVIEGGLGNDTIYGEGGKDHLSGEAGDDELYGGEDDDYIVGGYGADKIRGDAGNDHLVAAPGHHPSDWDYDSIWCDNEDDDSSYSDNMVFYHYGYDSLSYCTNDKDINNDET